MRGIPTDILELLGAAKGAARKALDINVVWAAMADAIEALKADIKRRTYQLPSNPERNTIRQIDGLKKSLNHYKRIHKRIVREGNGRNWGV